MIAGIRCTTLQKYFSLRQKCNFQDFLNIGEEAKIRPEELSALLMTQSEVWSG